MLLGTVAKITCHRRRIRLVHLRDRLAFDYGTEQPEVVETSERKNARYSLYRQSFAANSCVPGLSNFINNSRRREARSSRQVRRAAEYGWVHGEKDEEEDEEVKERGREG